MNKFKNFSKKAVRDVRDVFELGWKLLITIVVIAFLFVIGLVVSTIGLILIPSIIVGILFVGFVVTIFEDVKGKRKA